MAASFTARANAIRALSMDAVEAANSGHPGMPMGMADVATVLWGEFLRFDPSAPGWPDRDRFVLSAGHGSMLIYAALHLAGYAHPTRGELSRFRQLGSPCAGHPENFLLDGVEATTGPLGQGFAMAVGMAIAERHLNARFGDALVDHRTWTIAGDGCLMEGLNHEAVGLAGHLGLGRLIVLWDDNRITIDGPTSLSTSEDVPVRFAAAGWRTLECDGHHEGDIRRALTEARDDDGRPTLVRCRTVIGKGAPTKAGTAATHGSALGADEVAGARAALDWPHEPFVVPDEVVAGWAAAGDRGREAHRRWRERLAESEFCADFAPAIDDPTAGLDLSGLKRSMIGGKSQATRKSSEDVLTALTEQLPALVGGSADLTGSNNTKTGSTDPLTRDDYAGRYLYYGIREFGMAAAMNGMALHGGVVPYGGTFLVFSDYCRAAIRLSALQEQRVVYVFTHDSIGLGEDGPTHQPIEHLQSLRMIPNLNVLRPADGVETAECWELALAAATTPSILALSRQNLPQIRSDFDENRCARGAYRLRAAIADRQVVLIATGSEVHLALAVADALEADGIGADVVSMPCTRLFDEQPAAYRDDILPPRPPERLLRVSIEAGTSWGWERYTMANGLRIGIDRFGASAPAPELFEHFGFTVDAILPRVRSALKELAQ